MHSSFPEIETALSINPGSVPTPHLARPDALSRAYAIDWLLFNYGSSKRRRRPGLTGNAAIHDPASLRLGQRKEPKETLQLSRMLGLIGTASLAVRLKARFEN